MRRAVKAIFTTLALALALVPVVGTGVADASHVCFLDVEPETASNTLPGDTTHTLTASIVNNTAVGSFGECGGGNVVFFEIVGPNDPDGSNSPQTPDLSCNPGAGDPRTCTVNYTGANLGTDTIIAWSQDLPDDDEFTALDTTEGQDEGTTPGAGPEPDNTDVVTKTWTGTAAATAGELEVEPETDNNPTGTAHTLTATVPTDAGPNTEVDFEVVGPNDPNNDGDTPTSPDLTCNVADPTVNNQCTVTYTGTAAGTDTIRAWVDVDRNNTTVEADLTEGQNETTTPGAQTEPDRTDVVTKQWFAATPANTVLNCDPETAVNPPTGAGSTETYTCTATNTQGTTATGDDTPVAGQRIDGENLAGANDPDNAAATPVDFDNGCTTGTNGTCQINVPSSEFQAGTANICFFIDSDNDNEFNVAGAEYDGGACDTETQVGAGDPGGVDANQTDVVTKTWAVAAPFQLVLTPEADTNKTGDPHTVTATVLDQFGNPFPGANVDFDITAGPNNTTGLECPDVVTDANGQAPCTYTGAGGAGGAGTDTIRAFADVAPENDVDDDGNGSGVTPECPGGGCGTEPNDTAVKKFVNEPVVAADVEVDMVGCNGNTANFNDASFEATATNPAGTTHLVCAYAKTAGGEILIGHPITFTSTGPGHFADNANATTHADLGTTEVVNTDAAGVARIILHSNQIGDQTVTATAGGQSDAGVKTWTNTAADARVIDLTPNTATNPPGTTHQVTATVTDRFGNPVANVPLVFTETGAGRFTSGPSTEPSTINASTGANGQVTVETTTLASETGTQQISGALPRNAGALNDQCEFGANQVPDNTVQPADADTEPDTLAGTPAGVCTDTVSKTWTTATTTTTQPGGGTTTTQPGGGTTATTQPGGGTGPQATGEQGYTLVAADGGIFNFGTSKFFGSTGALKLNQPIVGMDHTPTTNGYWLVASDGGIFAFGDARFFGSTGAITLNRPIVGMRSTPTGNGYWLVASDGGIFAFGDAVFRGSTGAIKLNQPIVGMDRTPTGNGYWLVASDGGIFAFGDARFFGSTGAITLNRPVVGMARTNSGLGYHLVASDGGIFAFGDAVFRGSTGAITLNSPIEEIMPTSSGGGYWLCARDGGVFAFGNAQFRGSMGATRLNLPVVGCDAPLSQGGVAI